MSPERMSDLVTYAARLFESGKSRQSVAANLIRCLDVDSLRTMEVTDNIIGAALERLRAAHARKEG